MDKRVRKIAGVVRKRMEFVEKHTECFGDDLDCMCGIASAELKTELQLCDIPSAIIVNDCHAFVFCQDHIVDVTASQFCQDKIVIVDYFTIMYKESQIPDYWDWETSFYKKEYASVAGFIKSQKTWESWQRAEEYEDILAKAREKFPLTP